MFCRYCGTRLAKNELSCPACGKEQGPLFATSGYFGVLRKASGEDAPPPAAPPPPHAAGEDAAQPEAAPPPKAAVPQPKPEERPAPAHSPAPKKNAGGRNVLLLAVLVVVLLCAVVLNLKLGGVERTLNSANTKLDELELTVSQLQEAQAQQSEVLNELKQAVDAAQGKAPAAEPAASVPAASEPETPQENSLLPADEPQKDAAPAAESTAPAADTGKGELHETV